MTLFIPIIAHLVKWEILTARMYRIFITLLSKRWHKSCCKKNNACCELFRLTKCIYYLCMCKSSARQRMAFRWPADGVSVCLIMFEPVHEISNNMVCATSRASDQPAHTRSLIRAFASRLSIL